MENKYPTYLFSSFPGSRSPLNPLCNIRASTQGSCSMHQRKEMKASLTVFYASDRDIYTSQLSHINLKSCKPWKSLGGLGTDMKHMHYSRWTFSVYKNKQNKNHVHVREEWPHCCANYFPNLYTVTGPSLRRPASFNWYKDSYWKQLHWTKILPVKQNDKNNLKH